MQKIKTSLSALVFAAGTTFAVGAHGADFIPFESPPPGATTPGPFSGNIAFWGQFVTPSHYTRDYDGFDLDSDGVCVDFPDEFCKGDWGFGSDARLHYAFSDAHAIQFETLFDYHKELDEDGTDDEHSIHGAMGIHLIHRSGASAYGLFGGVTGTAHMDQEERSVHGFVGGEIAHFMDMTTLFGQIGFAKALAGDDYVDNLIFGRLGARHFFSPNTRLEGWVGYGHTTIAEFSQEETLNWLQLGANFEQQFDHHPFSWFVGYQGDHVRIHDRDDDDIEQAWVHTVKLGVRLSFGGSLLHEDRHGARTFDFMNLRAPLSYSDEML